jgi:hypothetical protein
MPGAQQDLDLGITTYVNGTEMNPIQIDTSTAATDQSSLASTSTRTVIVEAPDASVGTASTQATSTEVSSTTDPASTTQATSTTLHSFANPCPTREMHRQHRSTPVPPL